MLQTEDLRDLHVLRGCRIMQSCTNGALYIDNGASLIPIVSLTTDNQGEINRLDAKILPEGYPSSVVTEGMKSVTLNATGADGGWGADIDIATAIINDPSCATAIVRGQEYKLGTYNWPYSPHPSERRYTLEGLGYGYVHFKVGDPNIGYGDMMGVNSVELKAYCVSENVTRLDEKFMPLLTDANGVKWQLTVSTSGELSTINVI